MTTKRPPSTIPNIPEKVSANSKNTSPHAANTARNIRRPVCTTENYLKKFIPIAILGNSDYVSITKNDRKVLVVGDSHVKRIRKNDYIEELKNGKASFDLLVVQLVGTCRHQRYPE